MFMEEATVGGGFAPTRRVPAAGRPAARHRRTARSTRLHLDADRRNGPADVAQALLEVRNELAELGGDRGIAAQERPAFVVDRPGGHLRREADRQGGGDRIVELLR